MGQISDDGDTTIKVSGLIVFAPVMFCTFVIVVFLCWHLDKRVDSKLIFFFSHQKHMLWVLKKIIYKPPEPLINIYVYIDESEYIKP